MLFLISNLEPFDTNSEINMFSVNPLTKIHRLSLSSRNTQAARASTSPATQSTNKILLVLSDLSFREPLVEVFWMKSIRVDLRKKVARNIFLLWTMLIVINH
jgi:hypothetical protein